MSTRSPWSRSQPHNSKLPLSTIQLVTKFFQNTSNLLYKSLPPFIPTSIARLNPIHSPTKTSPAANFQNRPPKRRFPEISRPARAVQVRVPKRNFFRWCCRTCLLVRFLFRLFSMTSSLFFSLRTQKKPRSEWLVITERTQSITRWKVNKRRRDSWLIRSEVNFFGHEETRMSTNTLTKQIFFVDGLGGSNHGNAITNHRF
jgi:hypothetical protein